MAAESMKLRKRYQKGQTEIYLAAQQKVDYIQSRQPASFRGHIKSDEYIIYWQQILRHAPENIREFLDWNADKTITKIYNFIDHILDKYHEETGRINWGDSYNPDIEDREDFWRTYPWALSKTKK